MEKCTYAVLGQHKWNRIAFESLKAKPGESWCYLDDDSSLAIETLTEINPEMIFVLHWSKLISNELLERFNFVIFHMTDLPYGRGGSPLQNLIEQGFENTKITALQATNEIDGGPVYLKEDLSLNGSAQEIYERSSVTCIQMIRRIIDDKISPTEQQGEPVYFNRRSPEKSQLSLESISLRDAYDQIRMVDAEGYPKSFLIFGDFRIELTNAVLEDGTISASAKITHC